MKVRLLAGRVTKPKLPAERWALLPAAATISDTAAKLDEKSLEDVGEDVRNFVREKPALAVGIAAGVGYMLARLFRRR